MNIHAGSMFPGPDGFGRSVADNLEIAVAHQVEVVKRGMMTIGFESQQRQEQDLAAARKHSGTGRWLHLDTDFLQ